MPELAPDPAPPGAARSLHDVALLFNVAASTRRLQLIRSLAAGGQTLKQLLDNLGGERKALSTHLQTLVQSSVVSTTRGEGEKTFELTGVGRLMLRSVDEAMGAAPAEITPPIEPAEDGAAGSLDDLHAILKAFADPVRLRLLNLLASASEVCVCHLHEALGIPQSTASRHLSQLREAKLIAGRRKRTWIYYRLTRPANDLHRVLLNHLSQSFARGDVFEADKEQLRKLESCSERKPAGPEVGRTSG